MGGEINDQISLAQTALETQELERTPLGKKNPKTYGKYVVEGAGGICREQPLATGFSQRKRLSSWEL